MRKPISKRDAYIKELRHVADHATELASGRGAKLTGDNIGDAISFMLNQPGGDTYSSIYGELIAKGQGEQAKELELFHAKTAKAHQELISQGQPASYWIGPDGQPVDYTAVPVRRGKIGGKGYEVVTEIDEDYKRRCHALTKAANDEADYICQISELDGTAEDSFFKLYEESVNNGYLKKESFNFAVEKAKSDKRLAGVYDRFKNANYNAFHTAYTRWEKKRP